MSQLPPQQIEQYNQALNDLSRSKNISTQLPSLKYEPNRLDEILQNIKDWFSDFFLSRGRSESNWDGEWLWIFLKIFFFGVILVLLALIVYKVWQTWKSRPQAIGSVQAVPESQSFMTHEQGSSQDIEQALDLNQFSRACRLRWKLFLKRFQQTNFVTPFEWQLRYTEPNQVDWSWSKKANEVMFGKASRNLQDYQSFENDLLQIERQFLESH